MKRTVLMFLCFVFAIHARGEIELIVVDIWGSASLRFFLQSQERLISLAGEPAVIVSRKKIDVTRLVLDKCHQIVYTYASFLQYLNIHIFYHI